jgi:lipoprotein-anchoring transpeptidase ErfK/SrfK
VVRAQGWRALAVPILAVVTVAALLPANSPGHRADRSSDRPDAAPAADIAQAPIAATPTTGAASAPAAPVTAPPIQLHLASDSTACLRNTASTFVLVDLSQQHVWMCQGHKQVYSTPATTGEVVNGDHTPAGTWVVQGRQRNRYLVGPGYRDYVHYWIPFNGDFGFHDASWQTMPFGSSQYRTKGSHGCVHLPMAAVAWLYHWAQAGSTVVTVQA